MPVFVLPMRILGVFVTVITVSSLGSSLDGYILGVAALSGLEGHCTGYLNASDGRCGCLATLAVATHRLFVCLVWV